MASPYPPIEPREGYRFPVGDGHVLHVERCGRPGGVPAVFLHGGPGGGIIADHRRLFDPDRYDFLLFDQRGCGRSTPSGDLTGNTTWHLVEDIERLRRHIGVERWLVVGGSWGATLALAYAQAHPERVSALILRGVFTLRQQELDWLYRFGASELYPDHWADFLAPLSAEWRDDPLAGYHRLLESGDASAREEAALAWSRWEGKLSTLLPRAALGMFEDPAAATALARIETHFFVNRGWLREGQLLGEAHRLADIPGTIVQGRYDVVCPPATAFALHQAWPASDLVLVEGAGHSVSEQGILREVIAATDRHARRLAG